MCKYMDNRGIYGNRGNTFVFCPFYFKLNVFTLSYFYKIRTKLRNLRLLLRPINNFKKSLQNSGNSINSSRDSSTQCDN